MQPTPSDPNDLRNALVLSTRELDSLMHSQSSSGVAMVIWLMSERSNLLQIEVVRVLKPGGEVRGGGVDPGAVAAGPGQGAIRIERRLKPHLDAVTGRGGRRGAGHLDAQLHAADRMGGQHRV